jgi:hypothetical protein
VSTYGQPWEQDSELIDDTLWDFARGRREVRRVHDPLVTRILQLRRDAAQLVDPRDVRREIDLLRYTAAGVRVYRLKRKPRRTLAEQAEIDAFDIRLAVLQSQLPSPRRKTVKT